MLTRLITYTLMLPSFTLFIILLIPGTLMESAEKIFQFTLNWNDVVGIVTVATIITHLSRALRHEVILLLKNKSLFKKLRS